MNAPDNMKYDHLYQVLVAEGHPALSLIERAEEEGFASASEEYAKRLELAEGWEFDEWFERKMALQKDAQELWEAFDNITNAKDNGETVEDRSITEIFEFVKSAIKFIDDSRF